MKNDFNFCPACGKKNIRNVLNPKSAGDNISTKKWTCPDCGFDLYCNIAAAVGLVIYDENQDVLFEVRAKEPRKGFIVIPGGFVDADERAEEAAIREAREELNLSIKEENLHFLSTFPNTYEYRNITYKTCDMFFSVKLPAGETVPALAQKLTAEESEVAGIQVHRIISEKDIDSLPVAFPSGVNALKTWLHGINN